MKITTDTNVIVRAVVADNPRQSALAQDMLVKAEVVAIPVPALCEFIWVLSQGYHFASAEIAAVIRNLLASANVVTNRPAVQAGLDFVDRGGDFADGIIAYEGQWLGGATFISFDRKAVAIAQAKGSAAQLLVVTPVGRELAGIAKGARKTGSYCPE